MRYHGNKICMDEWTNVVDRQPEIIMPSKQNVSATNVEF